MRNFYLVVTIVFLFNSMVFSQQTKIDSISKVLIKKSVKDTATVSSYIRIASLYLSINPEISLKYADSSFHLAKKLKSSKHLCAAYQQLGTSNMYQDNTVKAKYFFSKSIQLAQKNNDKIAQGIGLFNTAYISSNEGKNKEAIQLLKLAYPCFITKNNKRKAANVLNSLGSNYFYLADYSNALYYYQKSLKLSEELKDTLLIATSYDNIALIYKRQENQRKAYSYFKKSIYLYTKIGNVENKINALNNFGSVKDQNNDIQGALKLYNEALLLAKSIKNNRLINLVLTNTAISEFSLKNYENALVKLQKTNEYYKKQNDINNLITSYQYYTEALLIASDDVLIKVGENPKEKYNKAFHLINDCLKFNVEIGDKSDEMYILELRSKILEKLGKPSEALKDYKEYIRIKDSIYSIENKQELLEKNMQFETDKKQAVATAEIQKQKLLKNTTFFSSGVVLISGIVLFVGFRKRQRIKQSQRELFLKAKISDVELKALRLQINPHFIFNSLNSISDFIQKNDVQKADHYLLKFAKLMRAILENSEEKEITIAEELNMLELYMSLEAMRLNNTFTYEFIIEDDIDIHNTFIPPLILQPFVENSIWHGLAKNDIEGKITIHITKDNSMLNCIVEDNGIGRNTNEKSNQKSYGMKITKDRLDVLNKIKNTNANISIVDLEKGTRVEVTLPLETENI